MIKLVVLTITVWATNSGTMLYEEHDRTFQFSPILRNNPIEECRKAGVKRAHELTERWGGTDNWISTNVDCHWEEVEGEPA